MSAVNYFRMYARDLFYWRRALARGDRLTTRHWPVLWREPIYWPRRVFTQCVCRGAEHV